MEFRILGPLEVESDGDLLPVGRRQPRALLTALLLDANRVVSRDRLVEAIWGEHPPEQAAKALQVYVSQLRASLGRDLIVTRPPGYLIQVEKDRLDLERFDELVAAARRQDPASAAGGLREALSLWRGPPLADLPDTPVLEAERRRLEGLRLGALEARIDADLALGEHATLVPELEMLVREHPLRERFRAQLMLALYRSGRQAEALEVFGQGRRLLVDELGLEPSDALKHLQKAILEHDQELEPPTPRARARADNAARQREDGRTTAGTHAAAGRSVTERRRLLLLLAGGALVLAAAVAAGIVKLTSSRAGGAIARVAPESVAVLDSRTNRFVSQVSVPGRPSLVAVDGQVAWIESDANHTIVPVSLNRLSLGSPVVPGVIPSDVEAGSGVVWALDASRREVVRIDNRYGAADPPVALPAPLRRTQLGRMALAVGEGTVWVTDGSTGLLRLDPRNGHVIARVDAHVPLVDVAVGDGAVWAISGPAARALEFSAKGGRQLAQIPIVATPGLTKPVPVAVAIGAGAVWVLNANVASVTRIDPKLQAVSETIPLGAARLPTSIAVGAGAAWVANAGDGTLARIDARTNTPTSIDVGSAPVGVAVAGSHVLVSVQPGFVATPPAAASTTTAPVKGALPLAFCSPVYFHGGGTPRFLIAADLPFQVPPAAAISGQISDAIRFILADNNYKAGRYTVGYQTCDDATAPTDFFTQAACRRNAHTYASSPLLIGVIGPPNSGCVEQELPILNKARNGPIATINGWATTPGLTRAGPGVANGEPTRLYPTGIRNFARVIADDAVQAAADVLLAKRLGSKRLYILNGNNPPYDPGIAASALQAARKLHLTVVGYRVWIWNAKHYLTLAARIKNTHADTVFLAGSLDENGSTLIRDLRAVLGANIRIVAPDGFSIFPVLVQSTGPAAEGVYVSTTTLPNNHLPTAGKRFVTLFGHAIGSPVGYWSVTGAQAAQVLLNAIAASNGTRTSVTTHLLRAKVTNGILGNFHFDTNGDTTTGKITIYQIVGGKPLVRYVLKPSNTLSRG